MSERCHKSLIQFKLLVNYTVLAFVGPPSSFPVEEQNLGLQKYLQWNEEIRSAARKFISTLPKGQFIGIHLRNGLDWVS